MTLPSTLRTLSSQLQAALAPELVWLSATSRSMSKWTLPNALLGSVLGSPGISSQIVEGRLALTVAASSE